MHTPHTSSRNTSSRSRRAVALVAALGLVAAACGGDDDTAPTVAPTEPPATAPVDDDAPPPDADDAPDRAPDDPGETDDIDGPGEPATGEPDAGEPDSPAFGVTASPPATGPLDGITWATSFEAVSLDPIYSWNYPENTVLPNMCESVLAMTADLELIPGLAADIDISDPLAVVLTLRDGVTFWNGDPMTVDDVVFSLRRNLDPALGSYFGSFWANVESVEPDGDSRVRISLTAPDQLFWRTLVMAGGAVSQRSFVEAAADTYGTPAGGLMCTGPYEFVSWNPGGDIVMTAYDGYWNPDVPVWSREVRIRSIPDDAALTNALRTGEIDGSFQTPVAAVRTLDGAGAGTFYPGRSTMTHMLIPSLDGPLGDARLRHALSLAIDRTVLAEAAWEGQARPVYSVTPPATWGYERGRFEQAYRDLGIGAEADPETARQLVDEVIAESGPIDELTIWAPAENPSIVTTANYVASVGQQIGLAIRVETVPIQVYSNWLFDPSSREQTDLFQTIWWTDVPDPLQGLWPLAEPGGWFNYYGYDSPAAVAALQTAFVTDDPAARAEAVIEAQHVMFSDDMVWIPVVNVATPTFLGSRVTGPPVGLPAYLYTPWAAYVGAP